jgi:hypothetical protein
MRPPKKKSLCGGIFFFAGVKNRFCPGNSPGTDAAALECLYYFGQGTATTTQSAFTKPYEEHPFDGSSLHLFYQWGLRGSRGGSLDRVMGEGVISTGTRRIKDESRR